MLRDERTGPDEPDTPNIGAMTEEEFDAYFFPAPVKLSSFPLDTHEWRVAFLREVCMQGFPNLFEAVSHAWTLMERPKAARCTYIGLFAGTGGKGKKALYKFFGQMVDDVVSVHSPVPPSDGYPSLEAWNDAVHRKWKHEAERIEWIIEKYALLLVGRPSPPAPAAGELIAGPWTGPPRQWSRDQGHPLPASR